MRLFTCLAHRKPSFSRNAVWFAREGSWTAWDVTYKCNLKNLHAQKQHVILNTLTSMISHWLFSGSSMGACTPMGDVRIWGPLAIVTSYRLFSGFSLAACMPTSDMKTWRPLRVVTSHWLFLGPAWEVSRPQVMWRLEDHLGSWPPAGWELACPLIARIEVLIFTYPKRRACRWVLEMSSAESWVLSTGIQFEQLN